MLRAICECAQFEKNALTSLATVRTTIRLGLGFGLWMAGVRIRVTFRPEICKLRMRGFEIAQRILQIAQTDKSRATSQR